MAKCPTVHEHPEFISSFNSHDIRQAKQVEKLKRFLQSDVGNQIGETLKHQLTSFKSFPRGHTNIRILFILCKNCKREVLKTPCVFCMSDGHSMDDAVLFYISDHANAYHKEGKKLVGKYKA